MIQLENETEGKIKKKLCTEKEAVAEAIRKICIVAYYK